MEVKAEYKTMFAEEAKEHLEEWEQALLHLERSPGERELIHGMFRAIHTLKGSAGFIGFDKLQKLTHDLESALQEVRDGAAELSQSMLEALFQGLDCAKRMVESFTAGHEFAGDIDASIGTIMDGPERCLTGEQGADLRSPHSGSSAGPCTAPPSPAPAAIGGGSEHAGRRRFELELFIQSSGHEAFLRAYLIRQRLAGVARIVCEDPAPEILKDSRGRFAYKLFLETERDENCLRETLNIDLLEITSVRELQEGEPSPAQGQNRLASSSPITAVRDLKTNEVVRVSVERLDTLLNLVGELVIQNSGFHSLGEQLRGQHGKSALIADLREKTEALAKVTRDLQDGIMKLRMLPVTNVFNRFHRVVRDLAKDRQKEVGLEIFGEETEIDKKVMDRIGDPLVHLVRNAVDHGIEGREERLAAGKAPAGLIRLGAYQDGDHICIEVSDDGRGLDQEAILKKAMEKGLIRPQDAGKHTDEQVLSLIFLPGFTTASKVTEVSGRGVGMDVVRKAVEGMGGNIRIRSFAGRGTTVTISLPLTMAIIPALLVEVGGATLAIPLSAVKEVVRVANSELKTIGTRPVVRLRDEVLGTVHLREALSLGGNGGSQTIEQRMPVVIVDYEEKKIGLGVDRILRTGEIVIKSLSRHYREIEGLIGASILGDGKIALIVDVEALVRLCHHVQEDERTLTGSNIFEVQSESGRPIDGLGQKRESAGKPHEVITRLADRSALKPDAVDGPVVPSPAELAREITAGKGAFLEEIHNAGAIQASISVSQMTGREVRVSFPESRVVPLRDVAEILGGEEAPVAGVYIGLKGELSGGIVIMIPQENLSQLHDLLHHQELGTCKTLADVDFSGISELGNVISASFINAMSDETRLRIKNEMPEIGLDMCLSVLDSVLARFNQPGEHIWLTKAFLFSGDVDRLTCHLLLLLEPDSLRKLINALGGKAA